MTFRAVQLTFEEINPMRTMVESYDAASSQKPVFRGGA
jgi:hypothetical protein